MTIKVEVDPGEVGFDAARLARIDSHFGAYVDAGRLPGWQLLLSRKGQLAHLSSYGHRDVEAGLPIEDDTIYRIYSMTKPITSVAVMMLFEEGAFELTDPVERYIPSFKNMRVYSAGASAKPVTVPATQPMQIRHLLSHTSGLTYGFHRVHPVDEMMRTQGYEMSAPAGTTLAEAVDHWASLPLMFEPGTCWNYSVATDVLGRLVEVVSGQSLDEFFGSRILGPLGMSDTSFRVSDDARERLAALYIPTPGTGRALRYDALGDEVLEGDRFLSGGGGLISTISDYYRFTQMLAGGGALGDVRLLSPRTAAYMRTNHLPGNADLQTFGLPLFAETRFDGVGFGLGFSVVLDPAAYGVTSSVGEYGWGGAASTAFFNDPKEQTTCIFMTQLLPSSTYPIRTELKAMIYAAMVGE